MTWEALEGQLSAAIYGGEPFPAEALRPARRIPAARALAIYRRNLFGGVMEHLGIHFAVTRAYLGARDWRALCVDYVRQQPPSQPSFTSYAAHLPAFLLASPGVRSGDHATLLPMLAQLDFLCANAFRAGQRLTVPAAGYRAWLEGRRRVEAGELPWPAPLDLCPSGDDQATQARTLEIVATWSGGELVLIPSTAG